MGVAVSVIDFLLFTVGEQLSLYLYFLGLSLDLPAAQGGVAAPASRLMRDAGRNCSC